MKFRGIKLGIALGLVLGTASISWGGTITINNPSFESPACTGPGPATCLATGWVLTGPAGQGGAQLPTTGGSGSQAPAFDGSQYGFANSGANLTQDLSTALLANTDYELTVWVLNRGVFGPVVELLVNGSVVAQASGATPAVGTWTEWILSYTSPASGALIGKDLSIELTTSANQGDFDLISLQAQPVPEPATILFAGFGLLGLAAAKRRFSR